MYIWYHRVSKSVSVAGQCLHAVAVAKLTCCKVVSRDFPIVPVAFLEVWAGLARREGPTSHSPPIRIQLFYEHEFISNPNSRACPYELQV